MRALEQPGVAVVAVNRRTQEVAGIAWAAGRIGEPNALVIGRHTRADLHLNRDPTVSLRHLAVVVEPLTELGLPGRGVTYRVVDLRTGQGFRAEDGALLGAICADGPAFLSAASYAFFFFVTGDPTDWPESAKDAWAFIPERVYLEERQLAGRPGTQPCAEDVLSFIPDRPITVVRRLPAPGRVDQDRLLARGERPIARVAFAGANQFIEVPLGQRALEDGVLVGRSDRCDSPGILQDGVLSRVHLMLFALDGRFYALDTASRNGSYSGTRRDPFRLLELGREHGLALADAVTLTWRAHE
jgi:hypothetical protein